MRGISDGLMEPGFVFRKFTGIFFSHVILSRVPLRADITASTPFRLCGSWNHYRIHHRARDHIGHLLTNPIPNLHLSSISQKQNRNRNRMSNLSSQLRYDGKVVIVTGAGGMNSLYVMRLTLIRWSWKGICFILCFSWSKCCRKRSRSVFQR
jgi:hypothetical protein